MKRWLVLFAVLALAGGCSGRGGASDPQVASAVGDTAAPSSSSTLDVVAQYVEGVRAYVRCMREHGTNLPDPGPRGEVDYSGLGPNFKAKPQFLAASQACAGLYPPMPEELQPKPDPLTPQQVEYVRQYARCMRANGVPSFPDPDADGHFTDRGVTATTEQEAAAMLRAGQICEPLIEGRPMGTPDPNATGQG